MAVLNVMEKKSFTSRFGCNNKCSYLNTKKGICTDRRYYITNEGDPCCYMHPDAIRVSDVEIYESMLLEESRKSYMEIGFTLPWMFLLNFCLLQFFFLRLSASFCEADNEFLGYKFIIKKPFTGWLNKEIK